ncbi:hypothetical protein BHE74_00027735 [Ensete ventricosum]|nr:hypothetical protein GW17_00043865 [Ensete ventricosum]RWW64995.1 hypothetical protein BHE74_00027735 [Ensete ventricosum]RZS19647.1 hypothetical protein BHM03_00052079 [Ensete ventricosum]
MSRISCTLCQHEAFQLALSFTIMLLGIAPMLCAVCWVQCLLWSCWLITSLQQGQEIVGASGIAGSKPDNADAAGDIKDDDQLDHINNVDSNDTKESDVALAATQYSEADLASQTVLDASGMQIVGDLTGDWKVVMHGQSNQYYYWNTVTGETSWEMPSGMEISISGVDLSSSVGGQVAYPVLMHANNAAPEIHGITNLVPTSMEAYGTVEFDKDNGKVCVTHIGSFGVMVL